MIELVTTWDAIVNALGAAAMLAFGVWILTLTPRTRSTKMLAVFAVAAGASYIPMNLIRWSGWAEVAIWNPYLGVLGAIAGVALLGLAHDLLEAYDRSVQRWWRTILAVVVTLAVLPPIVPVILSAPAEGLGPSISFQLMGAGVNLLFGAFLLLALVLAWVYRHPPAGSQARTREQAPLLSGALILWPAFWGGWNVSTLADPTAETGGLLATLAILYLVVLLGLAAFWLANANAVPERAARARNVALVIPGMLLLGLIQGVFIDPLFVAPALGPVWGVVRLATVVGLAYGILRYQVLGIDARFRWGVSRTTMAGVFIAVFFVASEGAQALFADFAGNELIGILAAGALVFILAPIQQIADRIARSAVPPADGPAGWDAGQAYRQALRMALADGEISPEEEDMLAHRAEELGLGPTETLELQRQVEAETLGDRASDA